jgi:hypothetical protein
MLPPYRNIIYKLGLAQLGEDGVVWAGEARPNNPNFLLNCVAPIYIDMKGRIP